MTSNLGSEYIGPELADAAIRDRVMEVVRQNFRPEFLNRVDDLIVFHRLTREDLRRIVDVQFAHLVGRLAGRRVTLELTGAAADWLAEHGYDPTFGARPLKRLIQTAVADPMASALLEGTFREGQTVTVDAGADGLEFSA
jgi:ATP-dependent Clp protease ATP-binding subunit ClpB